MYWDDDELADYPTTDLTTTEIEIARSVVVEQGFINLDYDNYNDGGLTLVTQAIANLTPSQRQIFRAWRQRLIDVGPGKLAIRGGTDGVYYEKKYEQLEPKLAICQLIMKYIDPKTTSQDWLGFA